MLNSSEKVAFTAEYAECSEKILGLDTIQRSQIFTTGAQRNTGETKLQQNSAHSAFPAVQRFGLPQPPPPGLSIRTLSPERSLTLVLPGIVSSDPSRRMIKVRPGAPSVP